jgi:hypothetical protein
VGGGGGERWVPVGYTHVEPVEWGRVEKLPLLADERVDGDIHERCQTATGPVGLWYVWDEGVTRGWTRVRAPLLLLRLRERRVIGFRCGLGPGGGGGWALGLSWAWEFCSPLWAGSR